MNATLAIIVICFLAFGAQIAWVSMGHNPDYLLSELGFSGANAIEKPWTFITSIFLHFDIAHLLSNMFVLIFFGTSVENEMGKGKMLLIFFSGAILGNIFSFFYYSPDIVSIGASAGIFALVGAGMIVKPLDMSFYPFMVPMPLGIIGILYAIYNAIGLVTPAGDVAYIAHLGGLIIGLAAGFAHEGFWQGMKTISLSVIAIIIAILIIPVILGYFGYGITLSIFNITF